MKIAKYKKELLPTVKIAIGSCAAIILAESLNLDFASSAGIITLLSILSTKWATVKLALNRILSYILTVILSWITFSLISNEWIAFSVFILFLVGICSIAGWKNTISVNAVIGTHFMTTHNFTVHAVLNELLLVVIGITVAIILNLFHDNQNQKRELERDILYIEKQLKDILVRIAGYLRQNEQQESVWGDIILLEEHLGTSIELAHKYQDNTFVSHPEYYIKYIEMRMTQCNVLHNLHTEMNRIRTMPEQSNIVADYIAYVSEHIAEHNIPAAQIKELQEISDSFRAEELPKSREEFEGRAMLYHIIIDLEEFLLIKQEFIEKLSEEQRRIYWK